MCVCVCVCVQVCVLPVESCYGGGSGEPADDPGVPGGEVQSQG